MGVARFILNVLLFGIVLGEPAGLLQANVPGNVNPGTQNRQTGGAGLTFAIPGLSLLGGNNAIGAANLFGTVTVIKTVVSTVSTVTTLNFRTCIMTQGVNPCAVGRKKRQVTSYPEIHPTPSMAIIIGTTSIVEPYKVSQYLDDHRPFTQNVIYPPGMEYYGRKLELLQEEEEEPAGTTTLYASHDTPDTFYDSTTETALLLDETPEGNEAAPEDKARRGLGRTTTVTSTIRITSVANSLLTSPVVTIAYSGCLPSVLPVTGSPCT